MNKVTELKTGIIIQARSSSSRLPAKMLLPFFEEKSILRILLERFKRDTPNSIESVLATSDNPADDAIENISVDIGIKVFRGSEENVLARFIGAAVKYGFGRIIRVCADNPFFDIRGTLELLEYDPEDIYDYIGYKIKGNKPSILSHLGFWGEVVKTDALEKVIGQTIEKEYKEHVTNYVYEHPDDFRIKLVQSPNYTSLREDIRLTVDTREDFEMSRKLYAQLIRSKISLNPVQIINFIDQHPEFKKKMQEQIRKNKK